MINQPVRVTRVGDLAILRQPVQSGVEYSVDLPFDVDMFDSAPPAGPYRTFTEAESAARRLWDLITTACD
jgi:hypothetical protein